MRPRKKLIKLSLSLRQDRRQRLLPEKVGNQWKEVIKEDGYVGKYGVGQVHEGSKKTPKGSYSLGFAFGTSNPGTKLPFRKITPNSYWISNVKDPQYNTWQERKTSSRADEHLIDYPLPISMQS